MPSATSSVVNQVSLITGGTDGLGWELAHRWWGQGQHLFVNGRRPYEELADPIYGPEFYVQADLGLPDGPEKVERALRARGVDKLDRLVLNAATGWYGLPEDQTEESIRELFQVNLISTLELCHRTIPLLEPVGGRIVFISTVVATLPAPHYAVYAATKAGCEGFFRALRLELQERGIEVQVLRPGATRTRMHEKSGATRDAFDWEQFPTADAVAAELDRMIQGPPHWHTVGAVNRLLRAACLGMPRVMERLQQRGLE